MSKHIRLLACLLALTFLLSSGIMGHANNNASPAPELADGVPKSSWWYKESAMSKYKKRDYEGAISDLSQAINIDPEVPEFYYTRGNAYALSNLPGLALDDYKQALLLNPDYLSSMNNLSLDYLKRGEVIEAIRYFTNYLVLVPKDPTRLFRVSLNNNYLNLVNTMGWESLRNDDLPLAIRFFTNYLKLRPYDADAYLGLSLVYFSYFDYEQAASYLDLAKKYEPSLFRGVDGMEALDKKGHVHTAFDRNLAENLFEQISNNTRDLVTLTHASSWNLILGIIYIMLGLVALFIFIFRINRFETYILYLGILNIAFGLNYLHDNPLIKITELPSALFWDITLPLNNLILPIVFILFIQYFIGWGWKKSILWLLIISIIQGLVRMVAEYKDPTESIYGTSSTIFGFLAAIVLFMHLFLPDMRKNREVQIIGAGLGFYLLAVVYENLTQMQWLPDKLSFDEPAYILFNLSLMYVAFKRITTTEKEYFSVRQDLEMARNIQKGILPHNNPKGENFAMSSQYLPMALIGGDYYDYHMINKKQIGLLLADVSGHGISAALIASMLKVAFSSEIKNINPPAQLMGKMNESLCKQLNGEFITAAYIDVDLDNYKLKYSSAGHPPLILYRRKTNSIEEIKLKGIPIGIFEETKFLEEVFQLEKNDRIILYTDGVLDVFNPAEQAYGKDRFLAQIKQTENLSANEAVSMLIKDIHKWSGKMQPDAFNDDLTLIVFDIY